MIELVASACAGLAVALATGGRLRRPVSDASRHRDRPVSSSALLAGFGLAVAVFLVLEAAIGRGLVAVPPALLAGTLPAAVDGHRRRVAGRALQSAWPDGLRDLVASLRAGASIEGALRALARTGPPPIRQAIDGLDDRASVVGLVTALEELRERIDDATTDRVVEVLVVAAERGGTIVPDLLSDLAGSVTHDRWMAEELETAVLEHRINAWAVFSLPWLVLLVLTGRAGPFADFYGSAGGVVVVAFGAVASAFGLWWVLRLGRSEPEPRVFGGSA